MFRSPTSGSSRAIRRLRLTRGQPSAVYRYRTAAMQIRQAAATARSAILDMAAGVLGIAKQALHCQQRRRCGQVRRRHADLCRAGRRQAHWRIESRRGRAHEESEGFEAGGPVGGPPRYSRQVDRPVHLYAGFSRTGHAAWCASSVRRRWRRRSKAWMKSSIEHIPGILKLVRENNFLGVVALEEWSAVRAARGTRGDMVQSRDLPDEKKLWQHVRATRIVKEDVTSNIGDMPPLLSRRRERSWPRPMACRSTRTARIGPSCAIAEFRDGKLISWSASQATHSAAQTARPDVCDAARRCARDLCRWFGLLRPQRP